MNIVDYIIRNKDWIFSGIGVFVLTLIFTFVSKRLKKDEKGEVDNTQDGVPRTINDIKAKNINFSQTIINNSKTGDIRPIDTDKSNEVNTNAPELHRIKGDYFSDKNELRIFLFKKLAKARDTNLILEIRHITDAFEEELGIGSDKAVSEIEKLEDEGIIRFEKEKCEMPNPYTRIRLTEKYFDAIQ